ncbi:hypothetical protein Hanom_Chr17g01579901 [Helianthus anomalus]
MLIESHIKHLMLLFIWESGLLFLSDVWMRPFEFLKVCEGVTIMFIRDLLVCEVVMMMCIEDLLWFCSCCMVLLWTCLGNLNVIKMLYAWPILLLLLADIQLAYPKWFKTIFFREP